MKSLNPKKITDAAAYIDMWLDLNFATSQLPAMQVAVQHEDKLVYAQSFGFADVDSQVKLRNDHTFRIASQSKTFTATALMQLVEKGKINLDEPVSRHLEWFKSSQDERIEHVTIRQLLNHTSGFIRDGLASDYWQCLQDFPTVDELKDFVKSSSLVYEGDERFKYSNFGFGYLGQVIEAVGGMPYNSYITKHIVERLGLMSTGPDLDDKAIKTLAVGYSREWFNGQRRTFDDIDTRGLSAATGFYSNATDICHYFSTHFLGDDSLLSDASKRQMQHGNWSIEGSEAQYGLGMTHYKKDDWDIYGHSGGFPGFDTSTRFDAKRKLVVTALINANNSNSTSVVKKLIDIIDTFQQSDVENCPDCTEAKKFEGRFYSTWGVSDIVAVGNRLFTIEPLNWGTFDHAENLTIIDDKTLKIKKAGGYGSPGETIQYTFDDRNRPTSIIYAGSTILPYDKAKQKGFL